MLGSLIDFSPRSLTQVVPFIDRYVGNLPPGITVAQLGDFVNTALQQLGFSRDHQKSVLNAWISPDGHYGFCEVRTVEEATAALTYLNGIQVGAYCLKIGRPKGYTGTTPAALPLQNLNSSSSLSSSFMSGGLGLGLGLGGLGLGLGGLGGLSSMTIDPPSNVIMATNLPAMIPEDQIKELFSPFGEVLDFIFTQLKGNMGLTVTTSSRS